MFTACLAIKVPAIASAAHHTPGILQHVDRVRDSAPREVFRGDDLQAAGTLGSLWEANFLVPLPVLALAFAAAVDCLAIALGALESGWAATRVAGRRHGCRAERRAKQ